MSDTQETPISRAIKRRKELQDTIKVSMKELEKIDEFLRMYRHLSADDGENINRVDSGEASYNILGRAGMGQTQPMFEQLALAVIRDAQRPLRSDDIIEAFRVRGHPIGGNETRTAWNRLWQAKERGVLVNIPRYGYWPADEPPPDKVLAEPPPKRKPAVPGRAKRDRGEGRPVGRKRALTEAQIKTLESWFEDDVKTRGEMARDLGGISTGSINNYRLAWLRKKTEAAARDITEAERQLEEPGSATHEPPKAGKSLLRRPRKLNL